MNILVWNIFEDDSIVESIDNENGMIYWMSPKENGLNDLYFSNDLFNLDNVEHLGTSTKGELIIIAHSHYDSQLNKVESTYIK